MNPDTIPKFDLRVLSLGAGVQSSTLYLAALQGLITPRPDFAVFADTQAEPAYVYEHLDYLDSVGGKTIPIRRVTAGNLEQDILGARGGARRWAAIPLRVLGQDGKPAMLRRQCTREYKIDPVKKEIRTLLGLQPRERAAGKFVVEQWIGISLDEVYRVKSAQDDWIENRWPLINELRWTRRQCVQWLEGHGYRVPKKSACYFCPYHDNATWRDMRDNEPIEFERAIRFDEAIRKGKLGGIAEDAFLHGSLKPLVEADFKDPDARQLDLFGNECEGMCGV